MGRGGANTELWWENRRERNHLRDPEIDGRIVLRWILRKWHAGGMDCVELAQDRDRWLDVMNEVMNLWVP